ncbi:BAG1 BAG family molecular chaperone regulator 1 [Adlercreutzia faecimuris]|uniref:BAG1 BAG family molecular chaperone regulator 1 n=1 Tax=Adlercreutzia faecimuris TaxID=2897341 RepID=A0ABS9WFU2_9ACTN|nr:BAG1 BAG family molecular chaperone regulator 1 [Adlercreutzia sp. JBNU-10]MCI2241352.1 BAG1 BAG family molecular chaperone regulator 1 [Adlercreutzia sp. JBNU-10]
MTDKTISEFAASEAAKTEDAIKDLERIEEEVVAEAEASVDDYDEMAHEGAAAAAAATAFDFDEAEIQTEMLAGELEEDAK